MDSLDWGGRSGFAWTPGEPGVPHSQLFSTSFRALAGALIVPLKGSRPAPIVTPPTAMFDSRDTSLRCMCAASTPEADSHL
jgi:hypothetical protein